MNKICLKMNKSYVTGSALRHEGQLLVFDRKSYNLDELKNSPCYMCIAKTRGIQVKDMCSKFGILGPVTGILGSLQSMEVIKIASGLGRYIGLPCSRMVSYNAFDPIHPFRTMQLNGRNPNCPECGNGVEPKLFVEIPNDVDDTSFTNLIKSDNTIIIDVRSRPQYTIGHLKDSINWPSDEIIYYINNHEYNDFINELKNRCKINTIDKIYIVCRRGVESRIVAGNMKSKYNLSNVFYNVQGGLHKYINDTRVNLPLL